MSTTNQRLRASGLATLAFAALLALPTTSPAQIVNLTSGNSTAGINLGTSAGMYSWIVDGGNQLNQQWFWYRIGGGLAAPINTIGSVSYTTTGSDIVDATYSGAGFALKIRYSLDGGSIGSGVSQIYESIMVTNFSGGSLDFHLFQYSDFNLGTTAGGDSVEVYSSGSGYDFVSQTDGSTEIQEGINLPEAQFGEAALVGNTLAQLNGSPGYNLNNTLTAGPGDVTWALQWDASILNNGSLDVFKNKGLLVTPVPEPSALALIALGLGALVASRRSSK